MKKCGRQVQNSHREANYSAGYSARNAAVTVLGALGSCKYQRGHRVTCVTVRPLCSTPEADTG